MIHLPGEAYRNLLSYLKRTDMSMDEGVLWQSGDPISWRLHSSSKDEYIKVMAHGFEIEIGLFHIHLEELHES